MILSIKVVMIMIILMMMTSFKVTRVIYPTEYDGEIKRRAEFYLKGTYMFIFYVTIIRMLIYNDIH